MRIFFSLSLLQNPNPGLFAVKHPLTYAETLIDYHLCPHPKYKFIRESHRGSSIPLTQKQFLHHTVMAGAGLQGRAGGQAWRGPLVLRSAVTACRTRMVPSHITGLGSALVLSVPASRAVRAALLLSFALESCA